MSPLSVSLKAYRPPRKYTYKLQTKQFFLAIKPLSCAAHCFDILSALQ